jgi:hypothetical protein
MASVTPPKRKPFVATTKSVEVFGDPPPKPRLLSSSSKAKSSDVVTLSLQTDMDTPITYSVAYAEPDVLLTSHILLFERQSVRWMNLSRLLWILTVVNSHRPSIDKDGTANFLQVMKWRGEGTVSDAEFTALYTEWMTKTIMKSGQSKRTNISITTIGLFTFRQILLENMATEESSLDLYVGILINELNRGNIGLPISKSPLSGSVSLCTAQWIAMAEDLFFLLDSPGYGFLTFDEQYFFSACLVIGLRNWTGMADLEDDLSIGMLSAYALQLLVELGAYVSISSNHNQQYLHDPKLSSVSTAKSVVTLPMFKAFLMKKGITEQFLAIITNHVKICIERLCRTCSSTPGSQTANSSIYNTLHAVEDNVSIGSPRLFQHAVLSSIGYSYSETSRTAFNTKQSPMIVKFLLTDAEPYVYGRFRASEGELNIDDMHENIYHIWHAFQLWGPNAYRHSNISASKVESLQDPIYELIGAVLVTYKNYQLALSKALIDMTLRYFSNDRGVTSGPFNALFMAESRSSASSLDQLSAACMNILPNVEAMLIELASNTADTQPAYQPTTTSSLAIQVDTRHIDNESNAKRDISIDDIQWETVFDVRNDRDEIIAKTVTLPTNEASSIPPPPSTIDVIKPQPPTTTTGTSKARKSRLSLPTASSAAKVSVTASAKHLPPSDSRVESKGIQTPAIENIGLFSEMLMNRILSANDPDYQAKLLYALQSMNLSEPIRQEIQSTVDPASDPAIDSDATDTVTSKTSRQDSKKADTVITTKKSTTRSDEMKRPNDAVESSASKKSVDKASDGKSVPGKSSKVKSKEEGGTKNEALVLQIDPSPYNPRSKSTVKDSPKISDISSAPNSVSLLHLFSH